MPSHTHQHTRRCWSWLAADMTCSRPTSEMRVAANQSCRPHLGGQSGGVSQWRLTSGRGLRSLPNCAPRGPTLSSGAERREGEGEWTLVVGLIDYCRQFTWKEEAESRVKRATVIHPRLYKRRLLAASARPSRQPLAHNNPPLTAKRANSCGSPSLLHDRFQRLDACRDEFRVACSFGRNS